MDVQVDDGGSTPVVRVSGDMDADSAYDVYLAVVEQCERGGGSVVLDLADVGFMDSVGLGMLIRSRDDVQNRPGARLQLRNLGPRVQRLLQITALTTAFDIVG
jgi:anti-sigma B factor antagonist